MRGLVAFLLLRAKNRLKPVYQVNGSQGILAPKKQEKDESGEMGLATKEMNDPIVAHSRPPPLPPVIGSLVALSLLDTWWNRSTDEDSK